MRNQAPRRVLVTGIAGQLAGRLAARLEADDRVGAVVGIDECEPTVGLQRTEYVQGELRHAVVSKVLEANGIDTLVHLAVTAQPRLAGGRSRMKERNVIGTMQLLAAAHRASRLRRVVLRSSTAVYAGSYTDPALLREDTATAGGDRSGYAQDVVEAEGYVRAFSRRRSDVTATVLRFASLVGAQVDSPLTRYFALPVVPTLLGFDPRVQLCHEDDALEVLHRSVLEDHPGLFNVAGPGIVYLSQAIRLAGKVPAPVVAPLGGVLAGLLRRTGRLDFSPEQLRLLLYGRVADITRLRTVFGYEPRYSTKEAFLDFVDAGRVAPLVRRETLVRLERQLQELVSGAAERAVRR